jgi:hypothetical protein
VNINVALFQHADVITFPVCVCVCVCVCVSVLRDVQSSICLKLQGLPRNVNSHPGNLVIPRFY